MFALLRHYKVHPRLHNIKYNRNLASLEHCQMMLYHSTEARHIGRKSKGQLSVFLFLFKSINSGFTLCKSAIPGVKDWEEVLMDCDYPSWDLYMRKLTGLQKMEVKMSFRSWFSNSEKFEDFWTHLIRSPMPLPKPVMLSFGYLFVMNLQQIWLDS